MIHPMQSLIDVLFCTHLEHFESIGTFPLTGSDHLMIYGTRAVMTPSKMTFRSFKHCNVDELNSGLSQVPWSVIDVFDDIK